MPIRRLPPLRALEAFVRVVRLGSAKAAASELALSPSALSRRVTTLEDFVGKRLFTRQHQTMKLTEEVDAMRTIGISPIEALVIPRILAATFMMLVLGFYSSVVAIIGGAVVGDMMLGIPFWTFLSRIQEVVPVHDMWVGLIKAPVFGLIVGLAGCYHGMQVEGNSEEVGKRTTMAVVSAIFAVIVLDAFFAVFFTEIGWG